MATIYTHGHSGNVGEHYVALAWSSVVDGKAAQPRSSEKNAASRAGQTPCTRWAVGILLTKALMSETAENRAFEEKQPLVFFTEKIQKHSALTKDIKLRHVQEKVFQILIRTVRGGFEHLLNRVRKLENLRCAWP